MKVRELRQLCGMTQREFAAKYNIPESTIGGMYVRTERTCNSEGGVKMSAIENKIYLELEEKYKAVVIWRRLYGCTAEGEVINGMAFMVGGFTVATVWEK